MVNLFFTASRSAYQRITETFDFVWPTSVALWNLRRNVTRLASVTQDLTVGVLDRHFVDGSGIRGANLKRACLELTWDAQQEQFATILLVQAFGIFEGWLRTVLECIGHARLEKALQFPTQIGSVNLDATQAIAQIKATPSAMIQNCIYPKLIRHPKNSTASLQHLLRAYRCFKECRNSLMHNSGMADLKTFEACQAYRILTAADLGVSEIPSCSVVAPSSPVSLSLRGVVGFTDIILRLIATYDAEFACASNAEREFQTRWRQKYKSRPVLKSKDLAKRERQIVRLVENAGFPRPAAITVMQQYLIDHRLASN
ncbi:MAG: hypothetical protein JST93_21940 [Acidobacteria bacterium]|nr:hypothetical protein [Acidobacteriota bacterium]